MISHDGKSIGANGAISSVLLPQQLIVAEGVHVIDDCSSRLFLRQLTHQTVGALHMESVTGGAVRPNYRT